MRVVMPALVGVLLLLLTAVASAEVAGEPPAAESDAVKIQFLDASGNEHVGPYFDVSGAYPGMSPQSRVVTLVNTGTETVAYDLAVADSIAAAAPSVAEALVATVIENEDRSVAYHGALPTLQVEGNTLHAGQTATFTVRIAWPDRGRSDNRYQGQAFAFDLVARARPSA